MRHINRIVLHCSAFDGPHDAAEIHQWHLKRGWSGIGYHAVVKRSGEIEIGRPHYWQGAHCAEANADSLGICILGNAYFTYNQLAAVHFYHYAAATLFGTETPFSIHPHNEFNPAKTCPNISMDALDFIFTQLTNPETPEMEKKYSIVIKQIDNQAAAGADIETLVGIINTNLARGFINFGDAEIPAYFKPTTPQKG